MERELEFNGKVKKYSLVNFERSTIPAPLNFLFNYSSLSCYKAKDDPANIWVFRENIPILQIVLKEKDMNIVRLDERGFPLPFTLMNFAKVSEIHPLYKWKVKFARHEEILCFINPKGEIEELHFLSINLIIKRDKGELYCPEFSDFFLTDQVCEEFNFQGDEEHPLPVPTTFEYAFVWQNASGKKKVMVLSQILSYDIKSLERRVTPDRSKWGGE